MDEVVAGAPVIAAGVDVGVITIYQDIGMFCLQALREQIRRPKDAVGGRPGPLRIAIQTVDEDDVNFGVRVGINCGKLIALNMLVDGSLS
jgi:hypothetical protein